MDLRFCFDIACYICLSLPSVVVIVIVVVFGSHVRTYKLVTLITFCWFSRFSGLRFLAGVFFQLFW